MIAPVLFTVALAISAEPARFALVVGSNHAEAGATALRFADDDAVAMHELLLEAGVDSVLLASPDADTKRLHPGTHPSASPELTSIRETFARQRAAMEAAKKNGDVEWIFYFSGHGDVAHGEGYVVLDDGRLTRSILYEELLAASPATENHVLVDACKSFFMAYGKGQRGKRERFGQPFATAGVRPTNAGFILSSSSDRDSHEWERLQAGVFSYELRSALRGAADADRNGRVSYEEIGAFLESANAAIPSPEHRPDFLVLPPGSPGELARPVLSWSGDGLLLDLSLGHVYVERSTGERVLDAHPASSLAVVVHLPADRPMFVRTADDGTERVLATAAAALSALALGTVPTARKGALHLAFERLFAEPFHGGSVRRYRAEWREPVTAVAEQDESMDVRDVAPWAALGLAAAGGAVTLIALERRSGFEDRSHAERSDRNGAIEALNIAAVTLYAVAVIAGGAWLATELAGDEDEALSITPAAGGLSARF